MALFLTYAVLQLVGPEQLPVSALVVSASVYLLARWGLNLFHIIKNTVQQHSKMRLAVGASLVVFAVVWISLTLSMDRDVITQRFFTIGPLMLGTLWIVLRDDEDFQTDRIMWEWRHLKSPRFRSYAAMIHGSGLFVQAAVNEVVIAIGNEPLWILSCGLTPLAITWCFSHLIVRGLLKRGGELRPKSPAS